MSVPERTAYVDDSHDDRTDVERAIDAVIAEAAWAVRSVEHVIANALRYGPQALDGDDWDLFPVGRAPVSETVYYDPATRTSYHSWGPPESQRGYALPIELDDYTLVEPHRYHLNEWDEGYNPTCALCWEPVYQDVDDPRYFVIGLRGPAELGAPPAALCPPCVARHCPPRTRAALRDWQLAAEALQQAEGNSRFSSYETAQRDAGPRALRRALDDVLPVPPPEPGGDT